MIERIYYRDEAGIITTASAADCAAMAAVGFPATEPWHYIEIIQHQRKRAGLTPVQQGAWRGLSIFTLTEIVQRLALARNEAEATLASAVDADHAAMLADSDTGADQDWQGERTAWTFADGSVLTISGPVAETEAGEALQ